MKDRPAPAHHNGEAVAAQRSPGGLAPNVADVQDAGSWFVAGAWIVGLAGLVGIVALVGFYDVLKQAGPVMIIAPIAGALGLTLVTASHVIPIAIAQELAPSYAENAAVFDTFASDCLLLDYFGNVFNRAVATPCRRSRS